MTTSTPSFDPAELNRLTDLIDKRQSADFDALSAELTDASGLKIAETRKGSGVYKAAMAGVTTEGDPTPQDALTNWANAARRAALGIDTANTAAPAEAPAE